MEELDSSIAEGTTSESLITSTRFYNWFVHGVDENWKNECDHMYIEYIGNNKYACLICAEQVEGKF